MPDSISDLTNSPSELTWKGKTYKVVELTLEDIGEFVRWCKHMAVVEADLNSAGLTERLRQDMIAAVSRDINSGYYEPGASGFVVKMNSPGGQAKILQLGMRANHPDMGFDECNKLVLEGMMGLVWTAGYQPFGGGGDHAGKAKGPEADALLPL